MCFWCIPKYSPCILMCFWCIPKYSPCILMCFWCILKCGVTGDARGALFDGAEEATVVDSDDEMDEAEEEYEEEMYETSPVHSSTPIALPAELDINQNYAQPAWSDTRFMGEWISYFGPEYDISNSTFFILEWLVNLFKCSLYEIWMDDEFWGILDNLDGILMYFWCIMNIFCVLFTSTFHVCNTFRNQINGAFCVLQPGAACL